MRFAHEVRYSILRIKKSNSDLFKLSIYKNMEYLFSILIEVRSILNTIPILRGPWPPTQCLQIPRLRALDTLDKEKPASEA